MKTALLFTLLSIAPGCLLTSCEREAGGTMEVATAGPWQPLERVLQSQITAMNQENLTVFMSYLHPENPAWSTTQDTTRTLFADYELSSTVEKMEQVSLTDGEAKIKFVQLTRKINGPAFRDNRVTGIHTFRRDQGLWKIYATEVSDITYLDDAKPS